MSQGGRITCPRCGSNNFDTVTACWKCGNPLGAGSSPAAAAGGQRPNVTAYAAPAMQPMPATMPVPSPAGFGDRVAATYVSATTSLGNPAAANRAAFWLGMLMPYFGLPIGLAFMMCDDRRRQEVGRICVLWSLLSGVIHMLLMFVSLLGMRQYLAIFMGALQGGINRGAGGGGLGGGGLEGGM